MAKDDDANAVVVALAGDAVFVLLVVAVVIIVGVVDVARVDIVVVFVVRVHDVGVAAGVLKHLYDASVKCKQCMIPV